jgi:glycerol kinase
MNIETTAWDDDLCRLFGVPIACLPEIRPTVGGFGRVGNVPVTASVVDQQAALYGHGCRAAGEAKITFGTGAFALAVTEKTIVRASDRGLVPTLAWSIGAGPVYAVEGGVYDAGSAIEWALRVGLLNDVAELSAFDGPAAIDRGVCFVPAFSGLACPYWDRSAAPLLIGMSAQTTRRDIGQALVEGIALLTCEVVGAIDSHVPMAGALSIDGGLSRSDYFAQFLADSLGRIIRTSGFDELTAFGTACLAAHGVGEELRPPDARSTRQFHPRAVDRDGRLLRFREAVSRARAWPRP